MKTHRAILFGGLVVGTLDGLDALIFFGLRGAAPTRIFQAIAAGLLGRSSFEGGVETALLGVALHYFIATTIVAVAVLLVSVRPALARRPFVTGGLYGIGVYLVMNLLVVPLSAATPATKTLPVIVNGVLIHILGVGIPAFWFATYDARRLQRAVQSKEEG